MSTRGGKREGAGRPKGVPNKATADVRELAAQYSDQAMQTLAEIMIDVAAPHAARVAASNAILDRRYGKPTQSIDAKVDAEVSTRELPASVDDFV